MDSPFQIGRLRFVWDEDKAFWNRMKHGVSFEEAAEVFIDPLTQYEDAGSQEEDRLAAIGLTRAGDLHFVVHIEREENLVRIISARKADANERKIYENHV